MQPAPRTLPPVAVANPPAGGDSELTADPARLAGTRWSRARDGLAHGGAEYALTAVLSYLPCWILRYRDHVVFACERGVRNARASATVVTTLDDERDAEKLSGHGALTRAEVEERLRRGDVCAVALEDGRVLASAWAAVGTRYLIGLGRKFHIPDDAFYIHDVLTEPDARRRGLATLCYQHLFERFASDGRRTAYAAVEVLNHRSIVAHARWGFERVGRIRKFRLPGLILATCHRWPSRSRWLLLETPKQALLYPPA